MDRRALPLLLASPHFMSDDETQPLDRIRMQKGVFLLENRGPGSWRQLYPFRPYDWGPFSRELASDLTDMNGDELTIVQFEGFTYGEYRTTPAGLELIKPVLTSLTSSTEQFIRRTRRFLTRASFSKVLKEVYEAYPQFATRSRFVS